MRNKPILLAFGILLVICGALAYVYLARPSQPSPTSQQGSVPSPIASTPVPQTAAAPGTYKQYADSSIASTKGTKVLFFHAPWCPQCRKLEASIKDGKIPAGVTIFKVDYDSSQDLRKKYGVTIQTTLVRVDDSGNLVKKYVAYDNPTLEAVAPNILQ